MFSKRSLVWFLVFGVWCLVFLCSCTRPLCKNTFVISGTYLKVISPYREAAGIVYEEFRRLNNFFNLYDPDSELSRLNKAGGEPFSASKELIEVLQLARQSYNLSGGAFDVSRGSLYQFWKKLIGEGKIKEFPPQEEIQKIKESGGMDNIEINFRKRIIRIKKEGLKIDLGGIAKGYMVDKAILKLKEKGIESALIDAGGDIYCLGKKHGAFRILGFSFQNKPWQVGIKDPMKQGKVMENQNLVNEAIATSGNYEQFFEYKGERYSHLVDPRTGYPARNNFLSVSVINKSCAAADSMATAFFIMGIEEIKKVLSEKSSTVRIFTVTADNNGRHVHAFR